MKVVRGKGLRLIAAGHEDPLDPGVLKRVLIDSSNALSGNIVMINWAVLSPGRSFRTHRHKDMTEVFIMLNGKADMQVDSNCFEIESQDVVIVSPGEEHLMRNDSSTEVNFLVLGLVAAQKL